MLSIFLAALESADDKERFVQIYESCHTRAEQTAMRILKNQHDAEDAVQNTFMKVIRHFERTYEMPNERIPYWVVSIAKNEALSIYRKRQKMVQFEEWDGVAANAASVTDYNELVVLFTKLPESYRLALEMKFLLNYSGKEIADRLGISKSAVNTRISRGRTLLREIAEKEGFLV